jgi:PKD repeat protein
MFLPARGDRRNRGQRRRGQSLAEFALVAPILLLLMLIALDFGRLFLSYVTLNNVVRVAANYGSLNPDQFTGTPNTATYDAIVAKETAGLNCDLQPVGGYDPPIPTYPAGTGLGKPSVSTMTCDFELWTPIVGAFFNGGTLPMTAEAQFTVRTGAIANIGGSVVVPPPGAPVAQFSFVNVSGGSVDGAGNVSGTDPLTVNVSNTSTNADTWLWDWGDGSATDAGQNPAAHTFTGNNTYTVTLTVTNSVGSSTASRTVTLTPAPTVAPVAGFYGTPQGTAPDANGGGAGGAAIFGSSPLTINFSNTSTGDSAVEWDFGDGSPVSTADAPTYTYNAKGVYTVTLTITDPTGGTPFTRTDYVTIGCVAPTFAGTSTGTAGSAWTGAGFTGNVTYQPNTANGGSNVSNTPPSPPRTITQQVGVNGGSWVPPFDPPGNDPWCGSDIRLRYQP